MMTTNGANFQCPSAKYHTNIHTIGYIDDNNLLINNKNITELQNESNHAIQTWHNILNITGGKLSNTKGQYIAMAWQSINDHITLIDKPMNMIKHMNVLL